VGWILLALPDGSSGDQLRSLRDWLGHESELRGRVGVVESVPTAGMLGGGLVEALTVGVGSGGAVTVLVSGVVSWLRQLVGQRRQPVPAEVTVKFAGGDSVKIVTSVAQAWTQAELADQIDRMARLMSARVLSADAAAEAGESGVRPTSTDAG
jgi:Effector Associated Constant Component 1